ncbi:OmpH family outer membrane protein [Gangjinia marincola]
MKKIIIIVLGAISLASCEQPKTAYVDNTKLIQEYTEMKDAESKFGVRSDRMRAQMDSVAKEFQIEVQAYQNSMNSMSAAKRQEKEAELMTKQQQLQQQQQLRSQMLRQESDAVIDSIVTKVKNFVKEYGKNNNYTYIYGSNESANIMYAKEGLDITDKVLEELNKTNDTAQ